MRCYYCGAELDDTPVCPICGTDVHIWKRVCAASNRLYNDGLDKAKVRDLSGAIESLRLSLRYNKNNVQARNLLGLVYYETGDAVAALSEWVISGSMDADDNLAAYFVSKVQKNASKLADIDQSLKKFNQSLTYCRDGNYDLAVIQLKKVVSSNPKLVKAQQLLALLYIQGERYDLAMRYLRQAIKIDACNTTTLRYMQICRENLRGSGRRQTKKQDQDEVVSYQSENDLIIKPTRTIADNSTVRTVLNLLIGAGIGVAFVCFLVIPEVKQRANTNAAAQIVETDQSLAVRDQTIETLQAELDSLNQQIKDASDASESAGERTLSYQQLLDAYQFYAAEDYTSANLAMENINRDLLDTEEQELYDSMQVTMETSTMETAYERGMEDYNARSYEDAISQLLLIAETRPDYEEGQAAYYLAYSYYYSGDYQNALKWFDTVLETVSGMETETSERLTETSQNMVATLEEEGYTAAE
ncbi:MAG: tetratricopeptide repeat protein [Lachnospiraceae bacterium]|nr:tetratricopeptide repeat protein [Lachnospiraceae bacterium]